MDEQLLLGFRSWDTVHGGYTEGPGIVEEHWDVCTFGGKRQQSPVGDAPCLHIPLPLSPGEGSVRLVGGVGPCQGRVEILHGGLWGTVCDDDWGLPDAAVVCRQLGCGAALAATTNAFFGYGTGHILLDNVHCEGGEPRLAACLSLGWGVHNCGHHEDAGALCAGAGSRGGARGEGGGWGPGGGRGRGLIQEEEAEREPA